MDEEWEELILRLRYDNRTLYVNGTVILGQPERKRAKYFGGVADFPSIADTFISGSSEITTICGSAPSNAEV